jgi:tetratricopeptide (TPR) repeat protein
MRSVISVAILALAAISMAQHERPKTRVDTIWAFANERMVTQHDVWFDDGEYLMAIQLLKEEAELWPEDYDVWTNLGWMQENVEKWDQALATYVRYRRDNPQSPDAALAEADYLNRKKLYSKIPELLEPEIKRQGAHPNNFRILARAYERQKMYADSVRVWKAYIKRAPADLQAKRNLDRVQKELAHGT